MFHQKYVLDPGYKQNNSLKEPSSVTVKNPVADQKIWNFFSFTKKSFLVNFFQKQYSKVPEKLQAILKKNILQVHMGKKKKSCKSTVQKKLSRMQSG